MSDKHDTSALETRADKTTAPPPRLEAGDLLGRYEIIAALGGGGMGLLYTALDTDLHRKVAIKLLRVTRGPRAAKARSRLLREARAAAQLNHPNVITVYEVGWDRGQDFLAMELVDGVDLERWLKDREPGGSAAKKRSWQSILAAFASAGRGLAAAHEAGLVHRDFKPANVLMGDDGRILVTDFGLVRQAPSRAKDPDDNADPGADETGQDSARISGLDEPLTQTGAVMGTPRYMAPEQFLGQPTDARTDQFSYCVALYKALYRVWPFPGKDRQDIRRATLTGEPAAPPPGTSVPRAIRRALERGLSRQADRRYPSMSALLDDLARAEAKRWPRAVAALGAVALFAAGGVWAASQSAEPLDGPSAHPLYITLCASAEPDRQYPVPEGAGETLRRAFAATDAPDAALLGKTVGGWVDRRWAAWQEARERLCNTDPAGSQPDEAMRLAHCLRESHDRISRISRVLSEPDADTVMGSPGLIYKMERPDCQGSEHLPEPPEPSADPAIRRAVAKQRDEIARVAILLGAHRWKRARKKANEILSQASTVDDMALIAEAFATAADTQQSSGGSLELASKMFRDAVVVAEQEGYNSVVLQALLGQIRVDRRLRKPSDPTALARLRALLERYPGMGRAAAQMSMDIVFQELSRWDFRDAIAEIERAQGSLDDEYLYDRFLLLVLASATYRHSREPDKAVEALQRAYDLALSHLGAWHFETASIADALAEALEVNDRPRRARELALDVEAMLRAPHGREFIEMTYPSYRAGPSVIRGRVLDSAGRPVSGADVIIGNKLRGNRVYALAAIRLSKRVRQGIQRVSSAEDGSFEVRGVPERAIDLVAESATGRSMPLRLEPGSNDSDPTLILRRFGSVRGTVAMNPPFTGTQTIQLQKARQGSQSGRPEISALVTEDGTFTFDRVPAGRFHGWAIVSDVYRTETVGLEEIHVQPHQTENRDIALRDGPIAVDVAMRSEFRTPMAFFALAIVPGRAKLRTVQDFERVASQRIEGSRSILFRPGKPGQGASRALEATYRLAGMHPGIYTACSLPMPQRRRSEGREWLARFDSLEISCTEIEVTKSPKVQSAVVAVTPMRARAKPEPSRPDAARPGASRP